MSELEKTFLLRLCNVWDELQDDFENVCFEHKSAAGSFQKKSREFGNLMKVIKIYAGYKESE